MTRASLKLVAFLLLAALVISCLQPVAAQGSSSEVKTTTITLITGDKVIVHYRELSNGKVEILSADLLADRNAKPLCLVYNDSSGFYVIPLKADLRKFDKMFFNIKYLIENGYHEMEKLPVIIKAKAVEQNKPIRSMVQSKGLGKAYACKKLPFTMASLKVEKLKDFYRAAKKSKYVEKVYLDKKIHPTLADSVPFIGAPELWDMGINGSSITIAILDTGIDEDHPNFIWPNGTSKVIASVSMIDYDFNGTPDESPDDVIGHGTHCAGIAAGLGVEELGIAPGVAPGAKLMNVKVLCNEGWGYDSWVINGIEWAVENGADVISMSLGGPAVNDTDPLAETVNWAVEQGVVVAVAAGNEGPLFFSIDTPGIAEKAITVGACDKWGFLAGFSSRGPTPELRVKPDILAPGVGITSSIPMEYGGVATWSGTSMATPHVAGAAALLLQAHPDWTCLLYTSPSPRDRG